jgi:transcriptional regulator with XRE-family HTH domain
MEGLTRVRVLRRERGLTQQELGRKSGLSRSFLSQVENGNRVPSLSSLTRISAALGVMPIDVLVRDEHEISEKNENRTRTPERGHLLLLTQLTRRRDPRARARADDTRGGLRRARRTQAEERCRGDPDAGLVATCYRAVHNLHFYSPPCIGDVGTIYMLRFGEITL